MMRCIQHLGLTLPFLLILTASAAAGPDPVEDLREALRTPFAFPSPGDPEGQREKQLQYQLDYRRTLLKKRIDALRPGDLRRALLLQEWRDQDRAYEPIMELDRSLRNQVIDRLRATLQALLAADDSTAKQVAIAQVGELGVMVRGSGPLPLASSLGPDLVKLLNDADPAVRADAARALAKIFPDPREVAQLGPLLSDRPPAVRRAAADALAELVRGLEPLTKSKTSGEGGVFQASTRAAAQLGDVAAATAAAGLTQDDVVVRRSCLEAISLAAAFLADKVLVDQVARAFPPADRVPTQSEREAVEAYLRFVVIPEREDLLPLARTLGKLVPMVAAALTDADAENRLLAAQALVEIGDGRRRLNHKARSVPRLPPPAQKDKKKEARGSRLEAREPIVLVALQEGPNPLDEDPIAPNLLAAIPRLAHGLSDPDVQVRRRVLDALESLCHDKEIVRALPAVTSALADPDRFVRWSAARLVGHIGPTDHPSTVAGLTPLLADGDLDVQMAAANALARLGRSAEAAVPVLARHVSQGDTENRVEMIQAIQAIGVSSAPSLTSLTAALGDPDYRVREAAAIALRSFGPAARPAIKPLMQAALNDPHDSVRKAASDALLSATAKE